MTGRIHGVVIILLFPCLSALAQERHSTFQLVNIPANAPLMAMGGYNITMSRNNPAQFLSNPSLVADSMSGNIGFHYVAFSGAYKMAVTNYHQKMGKGVGSLAVRHLSFGELDGYDPAGNPNGTFSVGQTALTLGYQLKQGVFSYGVNLDLMNINMAGYQANALALSIGGTFIHPGEDFTIGAVLKNVGFVISDFTTTSDSQVPWDAQLGVSYKPQYMPFRFTITGHHIFNNDLLYDEIEDSFSRELLSHIVVGTELVLSQNISVMAGYNHLIRQELKLKQTAGSAGFSYGFLFKTKKLVFSYGRGAYHVAGAAHVLSLNVDLNTFFRKI